MRARAAQGGGGEARGQAQATHESLHPPADGDAGGLLALGLLMELGAYPLCPALDEVKVREDGVGEVGAVYGDVGAELALRVIAAAARAGQGARGRRRERVRARAREHARAGA